MATTPARSAVRERFRSFIARVRTRVPRGLRLVLGALLILGGILGFLPILGFWMIPLGAAVAALDVQLYRRWKRKRANGARIEMVQEDALQERGTGSGNGNARPHAEKPARVWLPPMGPRLLIGAYLGCVLLPLTLGWLGSGPHRSVADDLAAGAGMLAYAILLAEFLLSGRFRAVSGRIGIDVTMRFHQLLARTALVLAVLHPLAYRYPSMHMELSALATGILAWVLLVVLFLFALFRDRSNTRYETWRLMHGVGAAAIAGLLLHHTLGAGTYANDPLLAAVWIALFAVAFFSLTYIYLFKPVSKWLSPWMVETVRRVGLKTWEVTIAPQGHAGLRYCAGQFVWLSVGKRAASLDENPFSIASAPASGERLQFIIKELGDFTRNMGKIAPGTRAYVDGPHGNMVVDGRDAPGIALIAGGVGIAPILGILRQLRAECDPRPSVLIYANRCEEQIVCREELDSLAREHGTDIVHALYEPPEDWAGYRGMCDAALIRREFARSDRRDWLYVLCGPPVMMDLVETVLIDIGVPARNIVSERFSYD